MAARACQPRSKHRCQLWHRSAVVRPPVRMAVAYLDAQWSLADARAVAGQLHHVRAARHKAVCHHADPTKGPHCRAELRVVEQGSDGHPAFRPQILPQLRRVREILVCHDRLELAHDHLHVRVANGHGVLEDRMDARQRCPGHRHLQTPSTPSADAPRLVPPVDARGGLRGAPSSGYQTRPIGAT
jgi:hypothetical protein